MKTKRLVIRFITASLLVAAGFFAYRAFPIWWAISGTGHVRIVNATQEQISSGGFVVSGRRYGLDKLKPRETRFFTIQIGGPSDYDFSIDFESGKHLSERIGYVTGGFYFNDLIIITNSEIIYTYTPNSK